MRQRGTNDKCRSRREGGRESGVKEEEKRYGGVGGKRRSKSKRRRGRGGGGVRAGRGRGRRRIRS